MKHNLDINTNFGRILYVSDIHDNIYWAQRVIDQEKFDHLILGGDYFDSFNKNLSCKASAQWLIDTMHTYRDRITVLIGNHDIPYFETWPQASTGKSIYGIINICSGYTNSKSRKINKIMNIAHWNEMKLCEFANGILFSHAGVRKEFWTPLLSDEDALKKFGEDCDYAIENMKWDPRPILGAGRDRGGDQEVGGMLWLDWNNFEDELPYPQIVGHTSVYNVPRQRGRSHCVDAMQTHHAIIEEDGTITVKPDLMDGQTRRVE